MGTNTRRVAVFLNPASGLRRQGASEHHVAAALQAAGLDSEIILLQRGLDVGKIVAEKVRSGIRLVVAAGGDGTVSAVGAALAGTEATLGVLPAGTLNHFARDLHLPLELDAAARVIASGETICVDVAEVNGRIFVNNSSIGLYPTMVSVRESWMKRGMPKRLAMIQAAMTAVWRFPNRTVRVTAGETGLKIRTPLVFVGNNEYAFSGLEAGRRARLQDGVLQVCTVRDPSRSALFRTVFLALIGRVSAAPDLQTLRTEQASIRTFRRHVKVALDGEVVRMRSPLFYRIRPASLKVMWGGTAH
jgi:diacylglycerol kinase family enzyme